MPLETPTTIQLDRPDGAGPEIVLGDLGRLGPPRPHEVDLMHHHEAIIEGLIETKGQAPTALPVFEQLSGDKVMIPFGKLGRGYTDRLQGLGREPMRKPFQLAWDLTEDTVQEDRGISTIGFMGVNSGEEAPFDFSLCGSPHESDARPTISRQSMAGFRIRLFKKGEDIRASFSGVRGGNDFPLIFSDNPSEQANLLQQLLGITLGAIAKKQAEAELVSATSS